MFADVVLGREDRCARDRHLHHPRAIVKNREDRLVVLNRMARSVVEKMRGHHPELLFAYERARTRDPATYAKRQSRPRRLDAIVAGIRRRPCTIFTRGTAGNARNWLRSWAPNTVRQAMRTRAQ